MKVHQSGIKGWETFTQLEFQIPFFCGPVWYYFIDHNGRRSFNENGNTSCPFKHFQPWQDLYMSEGGGPTLPLIWTNTLELIFFRKKNTHKTFKDTQNQKLFFDPPHLKAQIMVVGGGHPYPWTRSTFQNKKKPPGKPLKTKTPLWPFCDHPVTY